MKHQTRHCACCALAILGLALAGPASAATYNVDRFDDSTTNGCMVGVFGDCALRGAIIAANNHAGDDTVLLHTGTYALSIAGTYEDACQTGDLDVTDGLLIVGDGPDRTIIDAAGIDRVLQVLAPGAGLTIRGVTIRGGNPAGVQPHHDGGAGIRLSSGWLQVESCHILDNHSLTGDGGAISDYNGIAPSGLTIVDSWIAGNTAWNCSAVYGAVGLQIERTTISGNVATADSAVCVYDSGANLTNVTVSGNDGGDNSGVFIFAPSVRLDNCTLVVDNLDAALFAPYDPPTLANTLIRGGCGTSQVVNSLGGNLESPGDSCGLGGLDLVNVADPMLTGLAWYGGPSPVHRPLPGSPVVDVPLAGIVFPGVDQRGLSRPRDGGGAPVAISDIGAVELAGVGEIFVDSFECGFATAWSAVLR